MAALLQIELSFAQGRNSDLPPVSARFRLLKGLRQVIDYPAGLFSVGKGFLSFAED